MKELSKTSYYSKRESFHKGNFKIIKICCIIITALILSSLSLSTSKAEASLKIYDINSKTTTDYKGKLIDVTLNGTKISNSDTPGILVNGIALLPYDDIFQNSGIFADCSYDEKKGSITISKYNTTITMTIGSKTAKVNGKKHTMSIAPMKIKYVEKDKTKVLVPSRFVSETLGLGYTWYEDKNTVAIKKYTKLLSYNGGEKFEYNGTQAKVTIDGNNISLGSMPNIIINNTAMLRAKCVFASSIIKADYTYNKTDQSIRLSKNGIELVMTIGSKSAVLNGKSITLSTAPVYVTNHETNTSYVMVPGSITTSSLGYNYQWNNSKKTSVITTKSSSSGNDDSKDNIEAVIQKWTADLSQYATSTGIHEITNSAVSATNFGTISSVSIDAVRTKINSETFMIKALSPFHKLTSQAADTKITILADKMVCNNQTIPMNNGKSNLVNSIILNNISTDKGTSIELNTNKKNYTYHISLSADMQTLYVTVCYNALTEISISTDSIGDYLTIEGLNSLGASVTEQSGMIYIDLPESVNGIGDINSLISGTKYIKQIVSANTADRTQLILSLNQGYEYSTSENGNKLTISIKTKEAAGDNSYNIVIPKPSDVTSSMISDEDYYLSKYFVITLKGNYKNFFSSNAIANHSSTVSNISVSQSDNKTKINIATTKIQGYKITSDDKNIYVKVGNPKDIYKNIVILDPGHGGSDPGAVHNGTKEKDLNFKILYTLGKKYFNKNPSKLKVYYTRTTDTLPALLERAAFAKSVGADLFVSLHMNIAEKAPSAKGTEIFYSKDNNKKNSAGLTSQKLADMLLTKLYPAIGTSNRSVKEAAFTVIKKNTVPAVLIELGFMSNKTDYSIITNEKKQEIAVETIYNTLLEVFKEYPTGR